MRVLTFTTLFPNRSHPDRGIFVRERTKGVARICDVEVVAPVPMAPLPLTARMRRLDAVPLTDIIDGLRVHHPRFWSLPGAWPALKPVAIAAASWPLVRTRHAAKPFDLVDAHFAHPDAAAAAIVARRLRVPLVVSVRGSDVHRDLGRPRLRARILRTLGQAHAVVAVAQPLKDALVAAGVPADKVVVIENGVDLDRFGGRVDRAAARLELGLDDAARLVLAVGNLVPVKGHDQLLDAFARVKGRLVIAGDGPERARLEAQARRLGVAGRVTFLGAVPHDRLPVLYAAADVFALPSRNEGCPNVVLEATAAGCPVAAMGVGHVPFLVAEGENGLVAAPGDAAALAAAIQSLLDSPPDRETVRRSARARTWPSVARRVVAVFERSMNAALPTIAEGTPQCFGQSSS